MSLVLSIREPCLQGTDCFHLPVSLNVAGGYGLLFPELTASGREVCRLILQDKKLGEICAILDKKESNINSTRMHIRRKLNMQPSDNLRKVLQERGGKKAGE